MVRSVSSQFEAHLQGECTTLATLWKLTRRDGVVMGFTDHESDINFESLLYKARSGFQPTAVNNKSDFSVDNIDIDGILDASDIREDDLQTGIYDYAELEIHMINYADITQGSLLLKRGWLGEVRLTRGQFVAEVRGLAQKLSQQTGRFYAEQCDASLGDARCKVDVSGVTGTSVVKSVTSRSAFQTFTSVGGGSFFKGGVLTWTTGANAGRSMEVKEFIDDQLELVLPMPYDIAINDAFEVAPGCDKTRRTCREKFGNLLNYRGFPDLPGQDKIYETSSTRSSSV